MERESSRHDLHFLIQMKSKINTTTIDASTAITGRKAFCEVNPVVLATASSNGKPAVRMRYLIPYDPNSLIQMIP